MVRTSGTLMEVFHLFFCAGKPYHFGITASQKKGLKISNTRSLPETSHPQQVSETTALQGNLCAILRVGDQSQLCLPAQSRVKSVSVPSREEDREGETREFRLEKKSAYRKDKVLTSY